MKLQNNGYLSIGQLAGQYLPKKEQTAAGEASGLSFQEILAARTADTAAATEHEADGLKFSKHAAGRLIDRKIELTANQVERLSDGTRKAELKGIKDSLVIVDQLAFIVNVPNHTVVTAMSSAEAADNIFTNIDGAVIT